jgi:hypothetical protein
MKVYDAGRLRCPGGGADAVLRQVRARLPGFTWNALPAVAGTAISAILVLTDLRHFRRPIAHRTACFTKARG